MLSKDEKEKIKSLTQHPWWEVAKKISEQDLINLGKLIWDSDLDDDNVKKIIKENQTYVKARKDFIESIESNNVDFYVPKL